MLRHYRLQLAGNIVSNILVAVFTVISVPAIIPFFEILFDQVELIQAAPDQINGLDDLGLYLKYQFSQAIENNGRRVVLSYTCGFIVILFLLKNAFRYLSLAFMTPIRNGIVRDLRNALYNKVLVLSVGFFNEKKKGDLLSRFSADVQEVEHSILNTVEVLIKSPLILIGCITLMFYFNAQLSIFVFILIAFTVFIIGGISRTLKKTSRKAQDQLGHLVSKMDETIDGAKIAKVFNAQSFLRSSFALDNNHFKNLMNKIIWRRDLSSPLTEFLGITVVSVLLWFGSNQVFAGEMEASTFFAFIFAFFNIIEPSKSFAKAYYNIEKGRAALDRIDVVLKEDQHEPDLGTEEIGQFKNSLQLESVSFRYQPETSDVLSNVSMSIHKGKTIAIVGSSGAGKTTLVDLLCRFYDPTSGGIILDGVNAQDITLSSYRNLLSLVSQDAIVFHDTIESNIRFGNANASKDDVIAAAKTAFAHDFIEETEEGYQTIIGDRGLKLSGGQRQRLTLARAILSDSPIMILDEATSALDSESELMIQTALKDLSSYKTMIIIAHRLSTIQHADFIYVLKNGAVFESGTHDELLEMNGEYKKFVELQAF